MRTLRFVAALAVLIAAPALATVVMALTMEEMTAMAPVVVHGLAVFLGERRYGADRQQFEHGLRRPAQAGAQRRHDDRAVHQDRMRDDGVEQLLVAQ